MERTELSEAIHSAEPHWEPKIYEPIQVSDEGVDFTVRRFLCKSSSGLFICIDAGKEQNYLNGLWFTATQWKHARKIENILPYFEA